MAIRADMIGPRRLQPAGSYNQTIFQFAQEQNPLTETVGPITTLGMQNGVTPGCKVPPPPKALQPALIIRDELMNKSYDNEMAKAIRGHIDAMIKAGASEPTTSGKTPSYPKTEVALGSPSFRKTPRQKIDVSTPEHEHARLMAKKQYLTEKLDAHARAMHPENHPEVAHRTKVLNQVNQNLVHLEGKGIKSGVQHHADWMHHYSQLDYQDPEKASRMSPDDVSTALHAHVGALAGPKAKQLRLEVAGTHQGGQKMEAHPSSPEMGLIAPVSSTAPTQLDYPRASMKQKPMPTQEDYTRRIFQPEVGKGLFVCSGTINKSDGPKSDEWISEKIRYLMNKEGMKQDQAIAVAYSMAGRGKKDSKKSVEKSIRLFVER